MVVVDGTDEDSLKKGPGLDRRTYMPGEGQLVYIAGHRTTYLAPFAHIERMKAGDPISLEVPYGTFRYRVLKHRIVDGRRPRGPALARAARSSSCRPATRASSPRTATSSTRG